MIPGPRVRRLVLAGALCAWNWAAAGQEPPAAPSPLSLEASVGHESLSSPVVRIDPDSALILIDGTSRLSGTYGRVAGNVFKEVPLGGGTLVALSGRLDLKWAPRARDLDFTIAQVDATLRHPLAGASLGVGPTASHVRVAGARFRDGLGLRADLALPDGADGHWVLVADGGRQRHGPGYEDLDARVASVSLHRRIATPIPALTALDAEFGLSRTANRNGFDDLSNRGHYFRVGLESSLGGFDIAAALSAQRARFDAGLSEELAARRERFTLLEFSVSREISPHTTVRADLLSGRNRSNLAMYDNRLRSFSVTLLTAY